MTTQEPKHVGDIARAIRDQAIRKHPQIATAPRKPPTDNLGLGDPECELCGGVGFVRLEVERDHPKFGKLLVCPECRADYQQELARRAYERHVATIEQYSIIPRPDATFEEFNHSNRTANIHAAKIAARRFAQGEAKNPWLVLYGEVGTGKTHLAMAVTHVLRERQESVLFASAPDLLDLLRPGDDKYTDELLSIAREVSYLIIDDLGTENRTTWAFEKLYQLINHRYNTLTHLMLTLNDSPRDLPDRLGSRIEGPQTTLIRVEDTDYRKKMRREKHA
ncbi:MAG: ATP-binding protein [Chloroflexi bacterium]|jgi:DNA replication protein DnaC|nr:ATP-binding protein [Chloroflexota bacterium]